jgi:hypothetical protein
LFRIIEAQPPDLGNHEHLILFSYRAAINKIQETQRSIAMMDRILQTPGFSKTYTDQVKARRTMFKVALPDIQYYKKKLEDRILDPAIAPTFQFIVRPFYNLHTAASAAFVENTLYLYSGSPEAAIRRNPLDINFSPISHLKFMHVIPMPMGAYVIFGIPYHKGASLDGIPVMDFIHLSYGDFLTRLTTRLLLKSSSTWCVSPYFYNKLRSMNLEAKVIDTVNSISGSKYGRDVGFDMFSILP